MRKIEFGIGEHYHIFNRGNNKREIFFDRFDIERFMQSLIYFNSLEPIGSIYQKSFEPNPLGGLASKSASKSDKLVDIVAYCLNPNHFHLILEQVAENGIPKFMHRIGTGYAMYSNEKYNQSGSLFQGPYKAIHVSSNEYLLHLSAYVNLNSEAHTRAGGNILGKKLSVSSWEEYINVSKSKPSLCSNKIVLAQFKNSTAYKRFAESALETIKERKDMRDLLLEEIK